MRETVLAIGKQTHRVTAGEHAAAGMALQSCTEGARRPGVELWGTWWPAERCDCISHKGVNLSRAASLAREVARKRTPAVSGLSIIVPITFLSGKEIHALLELVSSVRNPEHSGGLIFLRGCP